MERIIAPTVKTMREEGMPYVGVLFAGLMLTSEGPKLIEYNARFGDPECQVLMMRMAGDIVPYLLGCARGDVSGMTAYRHPLRAMDAAASAALSPGEPSG